MVHPDYQYTPKLIPAMVSLIDNELYNCVLGSRILGGYAYRNGMPYWRYIANRFLTLFGNIMMGAKLAEYHTGYRAYSRELLKEIDFEKNSDDFVFDNQILAQILWCDYAIVEISCPARYMLESSSIDFRRSVRYGFAVTFLPVVFFSGFLPNNNPFAVQNIFLPVWFPVIVLLVMTLAAFWIRSLGKFIFYSMIAMTVMVTAYFFHPGDRF